MARYRNPEIYAAQQTSILRAAERCIRRYGFEGTAIAALCAEAGISAGRLYHYFPSKAAIIAALIAEAQAEALASLDPLATAAITPAALIAAVEAAALGVADPDYAAVALEIAASAARDATIAAALAAHERAVTAAWQAAIERGQSGGLFPAHLPADALAEAIALVLDGILGCRISKPDLTDAAIRQRVRFVLTPLLEHAAR